MLLGGFDGLHKGHERLLSAAKQSGLPVAAICISGGKGAPLFTENERNAVFFKNGIFAVYPFVYDKIKNVPARVFAREVKEIIAPARCFCGEDFRFGYRGEGDAEKLRQAMEPHGVPVCVVGRIDDGDGEACGTRTLRRQIAEGQVRRAGELMGRPFSFAGEVVHGKGLGHTLGFPTMNVQLPPELVLPRPGVYVATVTIGGTVYPAVTNVSPAGLTESFVFSYSEDAYGKRIRVSLLDYVRPMRKFESLGELTAQVMSDKGTASAWFEREKTE